LKASPWEGDLPNSIASYDFLEIILLGLGMSLRETESIVFAEPGAILTNIPPYAQLPLPAWDSLTEAAKALGTAAKL
jgi:hypothetical protein